jgi:hypothetical protein
MEPSNMRRTYLIDDDTLHRAADHLEILATLNYLICADVNDPNAVQRHASQSETHIRQLGALIQTVASR